MMANDQERHLAQIKGAYPYGHEQYNYDGDVDAQPLNDDIVSVKQGILDLVRTNRMAGHLTDGDITELIHELRVSAQNQSAT